MSQLVLLGSRINQNANRKSLCPQKQKTVHRDRRKQESKIMYQAWIMRHLPTHPQYHYKYSQVNKVKVTVQMNTL